jgi:hypothetical protein
VLPAIKAMATMPRATKTSIRVKPFAPGRIMGGPKRPWAALTAP